MIRQIRLENYKSFASQKINLGAQNIVIGNNASGKSNLIEAFRLIEDAFKYGLDNAYYMHGGFSALHRLADQNSGDEQRTCIEVIYEPNEKFVSPVYSNSDKGNGQWGITVTNIALLLNITKEGNKEKQTYVLVAHIKLFDGEQEHLFDITVDPWASVKRQQLPVFINGDAPEWYVNEEFQGNIDRLTGLGRSLRHDRYNLKMALLTLRFVSGTMQDLGFNELTKFYDFNARMVKSSTRLAGSEIKEDGSNFAFVLRDILKSVHKKKEFTNIVSTLLPSIERFETKATGDGQLTVLFKEASLTRMLPGYCMSDGTAYLLALIASLITTTGGKTMFFEEPDRYLHPGLSGQLMDVFRGSVFDQQLIITTHNQEFLRFVEPGDVKIIRKNERGESFVTSPIDDPKISQFLKKGATLNELFVHNLLG